MEILILPGIFIGCILIFISSGGRKKSISYLQIESTGPPPVLYPEINKEQPAGMTYISGMDAGREKR